MNEYFQILASLTILHSLTVSWVYMRESENAVLRQKQRLCHTKGNVGGIVFFFYPKLVGGTVAQRLNLTY